MRDSRDWAEYLRVDFQERSQKNGSFSLRSYARMLAISPTHLSLILAKKRKVSAASAIKIANQLGVSPSETLFRLNPNESPQEKSEYARTQIPMEDFKLISRWYHFAILGLAELKSNVADGSWIADKLGISEVIATEAFHTMVKAGYLRLERGQFRVQQTVETKSDVSSAEVRKYHKQVLHLASLKIEDVEMAQREFLSMTLAINPRNIQAAKEMIRKFKNQFANEQEGPNMKEVYQLNIQFFPVTVPQKNLVSRTTKGEEKKRK